MGGTLFPAWFLSTCRAISKLNASPALTRSPILDFSITQPCHPRAWKVGRRLCERRPWVALLLLGCPKSKVSTEEKFFLTSIRDVFGRFNACRAFDRTDHEVCTLDTFWVHFFGKNSQRATEGSDLPSKLSPKRWIDLATGRWGRTPRYARDRPLHPTFRMESAAGRSAKLPSAGASPQARSKISPPASDTMPPSDSRSPGQWRGDGSYSVGSGELHPSGSLDRIEKVGSY